ncbi:hypothetical protein LINPERPRIM_LOCUS450 [Linum perenne]
MHVKGLNLACLLASFGTSLGICGWWRTPSRFGNVAEFVFFMLGLVYINLSSPLCLSVTLCLRINLGSSKGLLFTSPII